MHSSSWDNIRFVLAVAEVGTVSGAATRLGVNHATVLRRVGAFEQAHGVKLFERTARGYVIPPDRIRILEAARDVEAAVSSVNRLMKGGHSSLSGVVRVTTTDSLSVFVMADILAGIRTREKGLRIEILTANAHLDFARLKADVTVRPAQDLPNDLSGEIAAHLRFAVYTPENPSGWAVPVGPLLRSVAASWVKQHIAPEDYIASSDSFVTLSALAPQINAKVILPCIVGDGTAGLHRDPTYDLDLSTPIWVASHADLAGSTRLREVRAALMRGLASCADGLDGVD